MHQTLNFSMCAQIRSCACSVCSLPFILFCFCHLACRIWNCSWDVCLLFITCLQLKWMPTWRLLNVIIYRERNWNCFFYTFIFLWYACTEFFFNLNLLRTNVPQINFHCWTYNIFLNFKFTIISFWMTIVFW